LKRICPKVPVIVPVSGGKNLAQGATGSG
jgi:hypothetical protein